MFFSKKIFSLVLVFLVNVLEFVSTEIQSFIVETLPDELKYNETITSTPTYEGLLEIINSANYSINIASMYWTMLGHDVMPDPVPESNKGKNILEALINANKNRSVKLQIVVNANSENSYNKDLFILKRYSQIRQINFTKLIGAGILHTKFMIVDGKDFYLGSANMDWRSLTHVKELGIIMKDSTELAYDLLKIFKIYWFLGKKNSVLPKKWPAIYDTKFNISNPFNSKINSVGDLYNVFFTSSPSQLCSSTRTNDLDAILNIINNANQFIYIAVMDYFPLFLYQKKTEYWPVIDDALKKAVLERNVQVRLLTSHWNHTKPSMVLFLKSLSSLNNKNIIKGSIETKLFTFPDCWFQKKIPFSEVNHNKYMVTDQTVYIGTSNWSADYFVSTGGVGIILNKTNTNQSLLYNRIKNIFLRDWNSVYAENIV